MKLSEIQDEWIKDSSIDELNLGRESTRVPVLHSKYLVQLSKVKLLHRKAESDYYSTRRLKYRYYRGEMTKEELTVLEWSQFQGNKPLKNEMDEFLQCDADLIILQDKVEYFKTVIFTLEQILRSINSRTWDIKTAVEYMKFTNGMM
jgi:hypothetical protein